MNRGEVRGSILSREEAPNASDPPRRPGRYAWAELMRRVFERDVLECPRCAGRIRLLSTITQPDVIPAMLECIGRPARAPPIVPSRGPPQVDFDFGAS